MEDKNTASFTDTEFMTAREKRLIVANWETFLKHGLKQKHFTKRLYNHLHLYCGYIAHYNIFGFYKAYFMSGADTVEFIKRFCDAAANYWATDYKDLNTAMLEVYQKYNAAIDKKASEDIKGSLDVLQACLNRARVDEAFARRLTSKVQGLNQKQHFSSHLREEKLKRR